MYIMVKKKEMQTRVEESAFCLTKTAKIVNSYLGENCLGHQILVAERNRKTHHVRSTFLPTSFAQIKKWKIRTMSEATQFGT